MKIGSVEIGPGHPCAIVAELSNAHNGDRDRLGRLIDAAQAAGADAIKVQCYTPQELVGLRGDGPAPAPWNDRTMLDLYTQAQTPLDWFPKIRDHCVRVGMPWFSSVFGAESLAVLEAVDCPAYKISHLDAAQEKLGRLVVATGKPVLVSTTEPWSLPAPYWTGAVHPRLRPEIGVLYCPGGYPAAATAMRLRELAGDVYVGVSSHCREPLAAVIAVARGAHLIETHFHLAAEPSVLESNVSLDEAELRDLVHRVRSTEVLLGCV
jgi:N-acetylneuraminate synthase